MIYPKFEKHCPDNVPENIVKDYKEACLVLNDSPNASAMLSRRCLQSLLRENNPHEIQFVIDLMELPKHTRDLLDLIRTVGNWSTYPLRFN